MDKVERKDDNQKLDANALKNEAERKKEAEKKAAATEAKFLRFRSHMVMLWIISNGALVSLITQYDIADDYLLFLLIVIIFFNGWRLIGSIIYWISTLITRRQEVYQANRARRESLNSPPHKPSLWESVTSNKFVGVVTRPLWPMAWFALVSELLVSPLFGLIAFAWIVISGPLVGLLALLKSIVILPRF